MCVCVLYRLTVVIVVVVVERNNESFVFAERGITKPFRGAV